MNYEVLPFPACTDYETTEIYILVFLAIICKNEIFQLNFHLNPFLVS